MKVTFNDVNYSDQRAETAVKCDEMSTSYTPVLHHNVCLCCSYILCFASVNRQQDQSVITSAKEAMFSSNCLSVC